MLTNGRSYAEVVLPSVRPFVRPLCLTCLTARAGRQDKRNEIRSVGRSAGRRGQASQSNEPTQRQSGQEDEKLLGGKKEKAES